MIDLTQLTWLRLIAGLLRPTGGRVVVVEDHWPEGGLGDAVLAALAGSGIERLNVVKLGVKNMPGSGTPAELLHAARDAPGDQRAQDQAEHREA